MSEYPEDIWRSVDQAEIDIGFHLGEGRNIIARAIMTERHRCADLVQRIRFMDEFDRDALLSEINQPGVSHMQETQWLTSLPSSAASSSPASLHSERSPDQR